MREQALPRVHPIDVPLERVDLAVVGQKPERMGQVPRRKGVGAVPLMHQGQRRDEPLVGQIVIEPLDLVGQQQAFINDHPRRQAGDIAILLLLQLAQTDVGLQPLANDVQLPFQHVGRRLLAARDEHLPDERLDVARRATQHAVVDRHVAPAEQRLPFLGDNLLQPLFAPMAFVLGPRQKDRPHAVTAGRG